MYSSKSRPTFFDILRDFELEMSDRFRETSFYFNQDVGDAASLSDDNECVDDDAVDDLETDHLTKPSNEPGCSKRQPPASSADRSDHRDHVPGRSDTGDAVKPASDLTDPLLAPPGGESTVSRDAASAWNGGDASSAVDVEAAGSVHRKDMLRNGHIPYNFVTTAARC